jgi:uroporphyrinogen-III synthase
MKRKYLHYPVIKIVPKDLASFEVRQALQTLPKASHIIFTSKTTVDLFFQAIKGFGFSPSSLLEKCVIAVGKKTAGCLEGQGLSPAIVPKQETAEGIIRELEKLDLAAAHFFWPHSGLSRPLLREYFELKNYAFDEVVLYDTVPNTPGAAPSPEMYEEILFTSPSTVTAYLSIFGRFPTGKTLKAIGPVTAKCLTARELACKMGKN